MYTHICMCMYVQMLHINSPYIASGNDLLRNYIRHLGIKVKNDQISETSKYRKQMKNVGKEI